MSKFNVRYNTRLWFRFTIAFKQTVENIILGIALVLLIENTINVNASTL